MSEGENKEEKQEEKQEHKTSKVTITIEDVVTDKGQPTFQIAMNVDPKPETEADLTPAAYLAAELMEYIQLRDQIGKEEAQGKIEKPEGIIVPE